MTKKFSLAIPEQLHTLDQELDKGDPSLPIFHTAANAYNSLITQPFPRKIWLELEMHIHITTTFVSNFRTFRPLLIVKSD